MRILLCNIFLVLLIGCTFGQRRIEKIPTIDPKQISTWIYHAPPYKSPRLKFTIKSALNKDFLSNLMTTPNDAFDGIQMSQMASYNIRLRWRTKKKISIYIGAETMTDAFGRDVYYFGLKKVF